MLTTQCPACHATLRFTPQALSATQGWARCGVCQHPFDAWVHAVMPVLQTDVGAEPAQAPELDRINDPVDGSNLDPLEGAPTPEWANSPTLEAEPLAAGSHLQRVAPTGSGYWGVAALVLILALLAQAMVWHFDRVINHMPILVPVLQNACQLFGCDAPTPSAVGRVGITQSSLVRTTPTEFRLDIELINRANFAVHTPVAQVTLLDMDERVLVRRVWPWTQRLPKTLVTGQRVGTQLLWSMSAEDADRVARYVVQLNDAG
ncbi:MAG: zinc-ribbon and DUF3426 domain-containing protein [Burkholderiaceae bacterium]